MSVWFVSMTFRMAMSLTTGEEMVVMRRRMDARKMKTTPVLFRQAEVSCAYTTNDRGVHRPMEYASHGVVRSLRCDADALLENCDPSRLW
jgi:hypothetical protein